MAAIANERDVILQATSPRLLPGGGPTVVDFANVVGATRPSNNADVTAEATRGRIVWNEAQQVLQMTANLTGNSSVDISGMARFRGAYTGQEGEAAGTFNESNGSRNGIIAITYNSQSSGLHGAARGSGFFTGYGVTGTAAGSGVGVSGFSQSGGGTLGETNASATNVGGIVGRAQFGAMAGIFEGGVYIGNGQTNRDAGLMVQTHIGAAGYATHAIRGSNQGTGASGMIAGANGYDFYADGAGVNYGPFTGAHDAVTGQPVQVGQLVVDVELIARRNISNTLFRVELSTSQNQKAVLGVVATEPADITDESAPTALVESVEFVSDPGTMADPRIDVTPKGDAFGPELEQERGMVKALKDALAKMPWVKVQPDTSAQTRMAERIADRAEKFKDFMAGVIPGVKPVDLTFPTTTRVRHLSPVLADVRARGLKKVAVNALGEGQVLVCGQGGSIQAGDLLAASNVAGYAMRQCKTGTKVYDGTVQDYTVARAREAVTLTEGQQALIACVYMSA